MRVPLLYKRYCIEDRRVKKKWGNKAENDSLVVVLRENSILRKTCYPAQTHET